MSAQNMAKLDKLILEQEAKNHEQRTEENRTLLENIRGTGTESLISHLSTECCTKALLLGTLHEHQQKKHGAHNHEKGKYDKFESYY